MTEGRYQESRFGELPTPKVLRPADIFSEPYVPQGCSAIFKIDSIDEPTGFLSAPDGTG